MIITTNSCLAGRESAGQSSLTSIDAKSPLSHSKTSRASASDCTLKLEEILHNLAHADRRLQVSVKYCHKITDTYLPAVASPEVEEQS